MRSFAFILLTVFGMESAISAPAGYLGAAQLFAEDSMRPGVFLAANRNKGRVRDENEFEEGDSSDEALDQDSGADEEESDSRSTRRRPRKKTKSREYGSSGDISRVQSLLKRGDTERASEEFYDLSRSPDLREQRERIKYLLGVALMDMGLNQVAAFQFVSIIKQGDNRFINDSLAKLSIVAGRIGDNSLVDYAISRINDGGGSRSQKDLLHFRTGEFYLRKKNFDEAAKTFSRVAKSSPYYLQAKYKEGLSWASAGIELKALQAFNKIIRGRADQSVTDTTLVTAKLAKARVYYQKKDWEKAIEAYRDIPRDSIYWHETIFEQSWAFFMAAQFRSVLSNFHTLHSPYYEQYFIPESLVLRAIVYLYICNYDEMNKVVQLFERIYVPVLNDLKGFYEENHTAFDYYEEFSEFLKVSAAGNRKYRGRIPEIVWRHLMKDGELRQLYSYLLNLRKERVKWNSYSQSWKTSDIGEYSQRALQKRIEKVSQNVGERVAKLVQSTEESLEEYFEQSGYLQFEVVNSQKEKLKKKISDKSSKSSKKKTIDEKKERDFFIQNGYEYWPFGGEYWLDEIGNYQYLGVQSCE